MTTILKHFTLWLVLMFVIGGCYDDDDDAVEQSSVERVDGSAFGTNIVGAGYTDNQGNKVVAYIPDSVDYQQIRIKEGTNPTALPDDFPFLTNKFIEVNFPQEHATRTPIQVNYSTKPYRVLVFDEDTGNPTVTAFDDSQEGLIEIRSTPSNGQIVFALVGEY